MILYLHELWRNGSKCLLQHAYRSIDLSNLTWMSLMIIPVLIGPVCMQTNRLINCGNKHGCSCCWFRAVILKLGAAAPQGAVKLKSGSRKIFKYLKKTILHYWSTQKIVVKVIEYRSSSSVFFSRENFWISLQYRSRIFLQVKEFCLFY
jgi:hypothetical protein